ncbi:LRR receptor-like serine/threonine-protein kinase EFR [Hibiscus syriacus]|uniref:LRR receptor-like serine/threonine-protein kinase EFR n=1 Tax=Hibiscus syriacus TaxID=106335 RepID=UPI001921D5BE|nr:LRR receptor-like serine/threonine-protein kinase EFR [Hibiscus syriacus]
MARIICTVYARICVIFEPFVPSLLSTTTITTNRCSFRRLYVSHLKAFHMKNNNKQKASKSGSILGSSRMKRVAARFMSSELSPESQGLGFLLSSVTMTNNKASAIKNNVNQILIQSASPNTVGAVGLTFRYANILIMAETYFYSTHGVGRRVERGVGGNNRVVGSSGARNTNVVAREEAGAAKTGCKAHGSLVPNAAFLGFGENGGCHRGGIYRVELYILLRESQEVNDVGCKERHLRTLFLGSNRIQGTIPVSRLSYLDLSVNRLEGTIPSELGALSELADVSFSTNFLTGHIPSSYANLSSLSNLVLMSNSLKGPLPEGLGRLPFLINLQIGLNSISGEIPRSLFNCSSLIVLAMAVNRLTGTLPPDMFTNLTSLTTLYLGGNLLSGRLPPSIGNASSLTRVDLANNSFSGQIPCLGNLPNVQILSLQSNELVNDEPRGMDFLTSLANSPQLEVFSVAENRLTCKLPSSIGNLSRQLSLLVMNNNFFEGTLPREISNLINVILIAFEHNSLTGTIPPSIGTLPNLQYILLHENRFSGNIPESLGNLTYLAEVHLLEGTIPSSFGNCQRLQLLDLSVNLLNGTIPRDIFQIPSFGKVLNLSFNSLTRSVPPEIDMSRNSFQGTIPNSLDKLRGMEYISLSSNKLTGNIRASLESLRFLQVLNLSRNQLSGEVPTAGVFGNLTVISLSENLELCDGVPDLELPKCDSPGEKFSGSRLRIVLIASFAFILASVLVFWFVSRKKDSGVHQVKE